MVRRERERFFFLFSMIHYYDYIFCFCVVAVGHVCKPTKSGTVFFFFFAKICDLTCEYFNLLTGNGLSTFGK